ncbi:MAG: hypothetical protein ACR2NU_10195, partial [Aeoliella sp.]
MIDSTNPYALAEAAALEFEPGDVPNLDPPQSVRYAYSAKLLQAFWLHRTLTCKSDQRIRKRGRWQIFALGLLLATGTVLLLPPA